jgi:hypothetical protein
MYEFVAFLVIALILVTLAIIIFAPFVIGLFFLIAEIDFQAALRPKRKW